MNIVNVRSPYIIQVAETGQIGSKIELSIWNKGTTEPTSGTGFYTLSKSIASTTQITNSYNVSNYVKEFIDNIVSGQIQNTVTTEANNEWVNFRVKRYKLIGTTYTLLDNIVYIGLNGFNTYLNGSNLLYTTYGKLLTNSSINKNILKPTTNYKNQVNYLVDISTTSFSIAIVTSNLSGTYSVTSTIVPSVGIYNYKIPLTLYPQDVNFIDGNKITINV